MFSNDKIKILRKVYATSDVFLPLVFGALSDTGRFNILRLLMSERDICVTDVAKVFQISSSAASQQLKILELTGLVRRIRMGKMVCYKIRAENELVKSVVEFIKKAEKVAK